jgi:hypothetical protein
MNNVVKFPSKVKLLLRWINFVDAPSKKAIIQSCKLLHADILPNSIVERGNNRLTIIYNEEQYTDHPRVVEITSGVGQNGRVGNIFDILDTYLNTDDFKSYDHISFIREFTLEFSNGCKQNTIVGGIYFRNRVYFVNLIHSVSTWTKVCDDTTLVTTINTLNATEYECTRNLSHTFTQTQPV